MGPPVQEVARMQPPIDSQTTAARPVVLVADDCVELRRLLNIALQREGFDVWLAADGAEAVEIFRHHPGWIDVLLLDVRMPQLTGPEALEAVRRIDPDVRACFMTAEAGEFTEADLLRRGAVAVFEKPFTVTEVAGTLHRIVQGPWPP